MAEQLLLYFDGRCAGLGTPGALATYGWVIQRAGGEVVATGKGIASRGEEATANVGEYVALAAGLGAVLLDPACLYADADCPRIASLLELPALLVGS